MADVASEELPEVPGGPFVEWGRTLSKVLGIGGWGPSDYDMVVSTLVIAHFVPAAVAIAVLQNRLGLALGAAVIVAGFVTGARYDHYLHARHEHVLLAAVDAASGEVEDA